MIHCTYCKRKLKGRSDKKFCDIHCRNAHHNARNKCHQQRYRQTHRILYKNRYILYQLLMCSKLKEVHLSTLKLMGFNFNYHTQSKQTTKGQTVFFCYDLGYLHLENNYFALLA